jgi:hypothetical protein
MEKGSFQWRWAARANPVAGSGSTFQCITAEHFRGRGTNTDGDGYYQTTLTLIFYPF